MNRNLKGKKNRGKSRKILRIILVIGICNGFYFYNISSSYAKTLTMKPTCPNGYS